MQNGVVEPNEHPYPRATFDIRIGKQLRSGELVDFDDQAYLNFLVNDLGADADDARKLHINFVPEDPENEGYGRMYHGENRIEVGFSRLRDETLRHESVHWRDEIYGQLPYQQDFESYDRVASTLTTTGVLLGLGAITVASAIFHPYESLEQAQHFVPGLIALGIALMAGKMTLNSFDPRRDFERESEMRARIEGAKATSGEFVKVISPSSGQAA